MIATSNMLPTRITVRVALAVGLLVAIMPVRAAPEGKVFRAGAATSNITGYLGQVIVGGIMELKSTHVHDELQARCLALDNGETRRGFVVCDSCMIPREVFDDAKRLAHGATGLPLENMLLSATHTHSAPAAAWCHLSGRPDPEYQRFIARRIADGIRRALHNLEPARIGWGMTQEPRHVFNRRWFVQPAAQATHPLFGTKELVRMNPPRGSKELIRPAGPVDPEIGVISVVATNGRPLAVLANYGLHYVGGVPAGEVSADYFGAFAENLKRRLCESPQDPDFVAILSNGASGDVNNNNARLPAPARKPYEQINAVANDIASAVEKVVRGLHHRDWAPLGVKQAELSLAVRKPTADEVVRAREIVARSKGAPIVGGRPPDWREQETVDLSEYPERVSLILQAVRIGDLGLTGIPCEVFAEIGLELKAKSPFKPSFTVSLANGYNGYLPTAQQHEWGGYETWRAKSSYLEVNAAEKITAKLLELAGQLRR